jgi:nicotinate-nucleotide pyrophosphorylase (carboxylating)
MAAGSTARDEPSDAVTSITSRIDAGSAVLLEASGGVRLDDVPAIAATGVDRISVGALTHSAPCLDVGLDIDVAPAPTA